MPSAVRFIFDADSRPMQRELSAMEALASRAGRNIQAGFAGGGAHGGSSGVMRESLVLAREVSRGNWTRVPGSITILAQKIGLLKLLTKSTAQESEILAQALEKEAAAASLAALRQTVHANRLKEAIASGKFTSDIFRANADAAEKEAIALGNTAFEKTRSAETARSLANAEVAVGEGAVTTLGPLAYLGAGLTVVGVAAYFVWRHFRTLREESENLRDILSRDGVLFSQEAEAMKNAAAEAQNFSDWLRSLGADQDDLTDKIQDTLKSMREEARIQREIAEGHGASKKDLDQMTIDELQNELNVVTRGKLEAQRNFEHDKEISATAEKAANDPKRAAKIVDLGSRSKEMAAVVDAVKKKMQETKTVDVPGEYNYDPATHTSRSVTRTVNRNDAMEVTVDGKKFSMSVNEAQKRFQELSNEEQRLVKVQKQLSDLLGSRKKKTENDQKDIDRLTKEANEIQADLNLKAKYSGQLEKKDKKASGFQNVHLNEAQRLGAYAATPPDMKQANDLLKGILHNTAHLVPKANPSIGSRPASFGAHSHK